MITLCLISISVGWLAAWYCKDLYEQPKKHKQCKKDNLFKNNKFIN